MSPGRERVLRDVIDYFAAHGIGDTSLRQLAVATGTSHRMLNYYFGSRTGLLSAVVEAVEAEQRVLLAALVDGAETDPETEPGPGDGAGGPADGLAGGFTDRLGEFWRRTTDAALIYGPLFFELSAAAMRGLPHAEVLRRTLIAPWLELLEDQLRRRGLPAERAARQARLGLAVARGLLFDLLVGGDRAAVDAAMDEFVAGVFSGAFSGVLPAVPPSAPPPRPAGA